MREPTLDLFDLALTTTLWTFLGVFLTILCLIALQNRSRPAGPGEGPTAGQDSGPASAGENFRRRLHLLSGQLQKAVLGLGLALVLGVSCGAILVFTPLAELYNPAQGALEETVPLRLTLLSYERFYEGFLLRGEVWNQTHEPLQGVTARVYILGSGAQLLEDVAVPVEPELLPGRSPGTFQLNYTRNSPFLHGYRVTFESAHGTPIRHVKGFDVE